MRNRLPVENSDLTLEQINLFLNNILLKNKADRPKDEIFKFLLEKTNALEFKWITRIILKNLKLGITSKKILQGLFSYILFNTKNLIRKQYNLTITFFLVFHPDANSLFDVSSNLQHVCEKLYDPQLRYHCDIQVFSHFKPMLLERCQIENIKKLFNEKEQYFVQCKYDGERSQMHMKDGKYKYFTRQGYDITNYSGFGETSSSGI